MNLYNKYILPKVLDFAMRRKELQKYREEIVGGAQGIVLEIGSGSGLNIPYYKNISKLYALDPSEELFQIAQMKNKIIPFEFTRIKGFAENIPLPNESVDSVVSTWTLCSVENPDMVLKEVSRVLKPDGKFLFVEHGKHQNKFIAWTQKIFNPLYKSLAGGCNVNRDMEKIALNSGLVIEKLDKFQVGGKIFDFFYLARVRK